MYKAIKEIGGYEIGDEIPTEKALVWANMYAEPHVEEVGGESDVNAEETVEEIVEPEVSGNSILEDYLARGVAVVKKNVREDDLSDDQLNELLQIEKSDKNRPAVIFAINKRLVN